MSNPGAYRVALTEGVQFGELIPSLAKLDPAAAATKLHDVLKGRPEPSDEDPKSNRARNIQFELWFAGALDRADLAAAVGGLA